MGKKPKVNTFNFPNWVKNLDHKSYIIPFIDVWRRKCKVL